MVDLHVHTYFSDGRCSPAQVVETAKQAGISALAITDHDSSAGLIYAQQEAARHGIACIAGLELSVAFYPEMHLLALGIDPAHPPLETTLERMRQQRQERGQAILKRLEAMGLPIALDIPLHIPLSRSHIARKMVDQGYVTNISQAFERYLGYGRPAYIARELLSPEQGITLIHKAGGAAVVAHPRQLGLSPMQEESLLQELSAIGLDGLEAYHPSHDDKDSLHYVGMAKRLGLIITGGSDYHGGIDEAMGCHAPIDMAQIYHVIAKYQP